MLGGEGEHLYVIRIVTEEYKNLQRINPEHPLLEMINLRGNGFVKTDKFFEVYNSQGIENFDPIVGIHGDYYRDLLYAQGKEPNGDLEKVFGKNANLRKKPVPKRGKVN